MPDLKLSTVINAPISIVFDLARSIDLHAQSLSHTQEKAIAGKTTGLIEKGETVTWQAKHFGITQQLTSRITDVEPHHFFADELEKGIFKHFRHEHRFKKMTDEKTLMTDVFSYTSPLGLLGKLADTLFLASYMRRLLEHRNTALKKIAEDGSWINLPGMKS